MLSLITFILSWSISYCIITIKPDTANPFNHVNVYLPPDNRNFALPFKPNGIEDNKWRINWKYSGATLGDWPLILTLSDKYHFNPGYSSISITIDGSCLSAQCDAFWSFSINDQQYFTLVNDFDGGWKKQASSPGSTGIYIYQKCSNGIVLGDASTLLNQTGGLRGIMSGGNNNNWYRLSSTTNGANWPVTFELSNNETSNTFSMKFISPKFPSGLTCIFPSSVATDVDLKLYLTPDDDNELGLLINDITIDDTNIGAGEADLRIVNGDNYSKGRIEIYHNLQWGTVCDDYGLTCASMGTVVCHQLGFFGCDIVHSYTGGGGAGTPAQMSYHSPIPPPSQIWLDQVSCVGTETKLAQCSFTGWGSHNCGHGEDTAIECSIPTFAPTKNPTSVTTNPTSTTTSPSPNPTDNPTKAPSSPPTIAPSVAPTSSPSLAPSMSPSSFPTLAPSISPTLNPSLNPSLNPTISPSSTPTTPPTLSPTLSPSLNPSLNPSISPSLAPSNAPSLAPSISPSIAPSLAPSLNPSLAPSLNPSIAPTLSPSLNPSLVPSLNPSLAPSLNPSIAPSIAPSFSPSLNPSLAPSLTPSISPTITPSVAPSLAPTQPPSLAPTQPPSLAPSLAPTTPPSRTPSVSPSISPTLAPSISPTLSPTSVPSLAPSISPTDAPTIAPTRYPTMHQKEYESIFSITYLIKDLENDNMEILVNNMYEMDKLIKEIIEQSYFLVTGLKYRFFGLYIENWLGYVVRDIDKYLYQQFVINKANGITLNSRIECNKHACKTIYGEKFDRKYKDEFEAVGTEKLRELFNNYVSNVNMNAADELSRTLDSQLIFVISDVSALNALYPLQPDTIMDIMRNNILLILLLIVFVFAAIVSVLAYIYSKVTEIHCIWYALMIYIIQFIAFTSYINVCVEINNNFMNNLETALCGIVSVLFILISFNYNVYLGGKISRIIPEENINAALFFKEMTNNIIINRFILLILISAGCFPVIFLLSSNIFNAQYFNSGLTYYELTKLNKLKIISICLMQNIPFLLVTCAYTIFVGEILPNMAFAFICSILSVICTPFSMADANLARKPLIYYIEIKAIHKTKNLTTNATNTNQLEFEDYEFKQETFSKFMSNKSKTSQISTIICNSLEYDPQIKSIEISKNPTVNSTSITLYIVHFIKINVNIQQIIKLYAEKNKQLKNECEKYFNVGECMITLKSTDGQYNININNTNIPDNFADLDEMLKTLMNAEGLDYNTMNGKHKYLQLTDVGSGKDMKHTNNTAIELQSIISEASTKREKRVNAPQEQKEGIYPYTYENSSSHSSSSDVDFEV